MSIIETILFALNYTFRLSQKNAGMLEQNFI